MSIHNFARQAVAASAGGVNKVAPESVFLSGPDATSLINGGVRLVYHNSTNTPMLVTQLSLCHGTGAGAGTIGLYALASGALQSTGVYMTTATSGGTVSAAAPIDTTSLANAYSAAYASNKANRANLFLLASISARTVAADGQLWMDIASVTTISPWCLTIELVPLI